SAREVNGEQRVPAHERRRERFFPSQEGRQACEDEDGKRAQRLVDPRGGRRRVAHDRGVALRGEREAGPVHGCRVAPVRTHALVGGVIRKGRRLVRIGVGVVHRADAAVVPVRVGVRREQDRGGKRGELNGDRDGEDRDEGRSPGADQIEAGEVGAESRDKKAEEEPRPACDSLGVVRGEKRIAWPGAGDGRGDEKWAGAACGPDERAASRCPCPCQSSSAARSSWAAPRSSWAADYRCASSCPWTPTTSRALRRTR